MTEENEYGAITISPRAIASVAAQAANRSYGVVGMASRNFGDALAHAVARDPRHGVAVSIENGELTVDLYVVVEYGTRIVEVAKSMAESVDYQLQQTIGMPVAAVNVHVQDLRESPAA